MCTWQTPPTWELAGRLIKGGTAGIIVPSYARNTPDMGKNLVLWQRSDIPPHQTLLTPQEAKRYATGLTSPCSYWQ
jgi:hypothetical protein